MVLLTPEIFNVALLLSGIFGMYRGIEINHPIYALIFTNLILPFASSCVNLASLFFLQFDSWFRFSIAVNYLTLFFHMTSWSIISALRYVYIEHKAWIHSKWPDATKLRYLTVLTQFAWFFFLVLINLVILKHIAGPYGWPAHPVVSNVPKNVQIYLFSICSVNITLPVIVSGIFYVKLVWFRSASLHRNKVEPVTEPVYHHHHQNSTTTPRSMKIEEGQKYDLAGSSSSHVNFVSKESKKISYDYNNILKESGQPFEIEDIHENKAKGHHSKLDSGDVIVINSSLDRKNTNSNNNTNTIEMVEFQSDVLNCEHSVDFFEKEKEKEFERKREEDELTCAIRC